MNRTLIDLPNLVNSKDFEGIDKLITSIRESKKPTYLINDNSQIEAVITPIPVFNNSEKAQEEREEAAQKTEDELEQFWEQNPELAKRTGTISKKEMRKYAY